MATEIDNAKPEKTFSNQSIVTADLETSVANLSLQDETSQTEPGDAPDRQKPAIPPQRLIIYTRSQLLLLHNSPLVKAPPDMPSLKEWFGVENEQALMSKKEPEPSTTSASRDRRFRRDAEDAETPARPTFRSALTQPSQMGNFKHQSTRAGDRDRDKEVDKDRERDLRDKEGQERLRNLSDKYDRERLALPSNLTGLRNKERDPAPHLATVSSSSRASTQTQTSTIASRRAETREAAKKKAGEISEDWRRGTDGRSTREDRPDNARKDRDEHERERRRSRSRVRDTSRPRRDASLPRRYRDYDWAGEDRERRRRDGDGERHREREQDRELELDDPRRWRDDGKRDERLAARRERLADRDLRERERERAAHDKPSLDSGSLDRQDRRWAATDERDGRSKRSSGRDRRTGVPDEGKDKDERKDREREKEKEPAWMDTYIPSTSNGGALGSKGGDGELDGIQVWKKGMKEREQRDKCPPKTEEHAGADLSVLSESTEAPERQLDEIQLFKLMMKREEEKKRAQKADDSPLDELRQGGSSLLPDRIRDQRKVSASSNSDHAASPAPRHVKENSSIPVPALPSESSPSVSSPQIHIPPVNSSDGPRSLLSILASSSSPESVFSVNSNTSSVGTSLDRVKVPASRLASNSLSPESVPSVTRPIVDHISAASSASVQFQPPQGSRLLAFGARAPPSASAQQTVKSQSSLPNGVHSQLSAQQTSHHQSAQLYPLQNACVASLPHASDNPINHGSLKTEPLTTQQGFSPFEDPRGAGSYANHHDSLGRTSVVSERMPFNATSESGPYSDLGASNANSLSLNHPGLSLESSNTIGGNTYATGKGSRLAKFFDGKSRDGAPLTAKAQTPPVGFTSSSPIPGQRQDQVSFNGMIGGNSTDRAMDDLFVMLNNSAQGQRGNLVNPAPSGALSFGQGHSVHSLQQQMHQPQQHLSNHNRLDSLYESRLDDRNFTPDGMVPGLRSAPPPRSRENSGMFSDPLDDPMPFNTQRLPLQRSLDQMYSGAPYQQAGISRNVGMPLQQPHYRGGPSPISNQNSLQGAPQQRLPPGLANLGGRPPHEPSQFLGMSGMQPGLHGALHANGSSQQGFNNFGTAGGGLGFGGGPQIRLPPPGPHQLQNPHSHNQMAGLGHPGNMDLRGPGQAQLLSMGGMGGLRNNSGGFGPQHGPNGQIQAPLMGMRQQQQQQQQQQPQQLPHHQQQQHLPPHMMPHLLPPHLQQGGNNQPAHDLMALLMGGSHRE